MLAVLTLAALLAQSSRTAATESGRAGCPVSPVEPFVVSPRICDVIEVTGRIDQSGVTLDPAFDGHAPQSDFARPVPGSATLSGYDRAGALLFEFPFSAEGAFHLVLPLAATTAHELAHLTLSANGETAERYGTGAFEPSVETISTSDSNLVFIWNAHAFPGIRIESARDHSTILTSQGADSYEQVNVATSERSFIVSFSDGVRSIQRTVHVMGR